MASFTFTREVAAPPETVFDVLTDHRRYAEITPLRKSELEREGEPAPNGVGAIRVLTARRAADARGSDRLRARRSRFSYTVLSGLPVRDHVGTVELTPERAAAPRMVYAVQHARRPCRSSASPSSPPQAGDQSS